MISREEADKLRRPFFICGGCGYIDIKKKIPDARKFYANPHRFRCPKCGSDDFTINGL